jgi:hypothetical protein
MGSRTAPHPRINAASKVEWPEVFTVLGSGAVGGLAASLLTQSSHAGIFGAWPWYKDAPAEMLFGGIAALAGVYMFMRANVMSAPTLVFALLCGVTWNPIIIGAQGYVKGYIGKQSADAAKAVVSQLPDMTTNPQTAEANIQQATNALAAPLKRLNEIPQADDKDAIVKAANGVITTVASAPGVDPAVKISAFQTIGTAAANSDFATRQKAIDALNNIASEKPAFKAQVLEAVQSIKEQMPTPR